MTEKKLYKDFSRILLWDELCQKESFQKTEDFGKRLVQTKTRKMALHCLLKIFFL